MYGQPAREAGQATTRTRDAQRVLERLRADGRRITTARRTVIDLIAESREHLTAEVLALRIQAAHPEIHLSTVYRTLDALCAWGFVVHVHQPHGASFFHLAGSHAHLVCEQCGRIRDVSASDFDDLVSQLRDRHDFDVDVGHAAFAGRCRQHALAGPPV
jgi:Fur family ferric uptake transcriptional regulator